VTKTLENIRDWAFAIFLGAVFGLMVYKHWALPIGLALSLILILFVLRFPYFAIVMPFYGVFFTRSLHVAAGINYNLLSWFLLVVFYAFAVLVILHRRPNIIDFTPNAAVWISTVFLCDVSDWEQVNQTVEQINKLWGKIDILVNNAGITKDNLILRMTPEDWDAVMRVNLKGAFLFTKAVVRPMMRNKYGKIVNISSVVGIFGNAGQANYSASKAGLLGFTKSVAKEFAKKGIRCNAVAPGFIETDMTKGLPEDVKNTFINNTPLGYPGSPDDVANVVVFLCSPESDYITGEIIRVDGGMAM